MKLSQLGELLLTADKAHAEQQPITVASLNAILGPIDVVPAPIIVPAAPPYVPPSLRLPHPDILWRATFQHSPGVYGFGEQSFKGLARARILPDDGRAPGYGTVRLHTEHGDNNVAGSGSWERNDLILSRSITRGNAGTESWWAHSIRFPSTYNQPPKSEATWNGSVVFDFHNTTDGAGQANFQVQVMPAEVTSPDRPSGICFQLAYGDQFKSTNIPYPPSGKPGIPVIKGVWYDFKYHVRWAADNTGFFYGWVNGILFVSHINKPTLYSGQGVYLKLANYHTPHGVSVDVDHSAVIIGTSEASVTEHLKA